MVPIAFEFIQPVEHRQYLRLLLGVKLVDYVPVEADLGAIGA